MKPKEVRDLIAESIWSNKSAQDVERFCIRLGLAPKSEGEPDPFDSKRAYVKRRLDEKNLPQLLEITEMVLEEWDDPELERVLARGSAHAPDGSMRNLIFAANGPKPKIVLKDAINNIVEVVENSEYCLFYDRPLGESGLKWADLVSWWKSVLRTELEDRDVALHLWNRLQESLQSDVEKRLFRSYAERYGRQGFHIPALIPQVYLHYDPYSVASGRGGSLVRQRMDFLLLMPSGSRVVLEVDGKQHYSDSDNMAAPARYAEMVAEDRELRLAGYEIYRFGGFELTATHKSSAVLTDFFDRLLARHGVFR